MSGDKKSENSKTPSVQDLLAIELARDEKAVDLLAEQVLNDARKTVFRELRGIAVVLAFILSILGISTWWSIDDKVKSQVTTAVSETLKEHDDEIQKGQNNLLIKLGALQQQTGDIEGQAKATRDLLDRARQSTEALNAESVKALEEIRSELEVVRAESKRTQTYLITVRSGPPSDLASDTTEARLFFGELAEHVCAIAGSSEYGRGADLGFNGAFTFAFIKAMDSAADINHDGVISFGELAVACRPLLPSPQRAVFGGNDVPLLAIKDRPVRKPANRRLHALLVGLNSLDPKAYNGWDAPLSGPERDVDGIKQQLEDNKRVLASDVSIEVLKTKDATRSRIVESIKAMGSKTSKDDIVLFFYSGHGAERPAVNTESQSGLVKTFVAYDGQIDMSEVVTLLQAIKAYRLVLIIDA